MKYICGIYGYQITREIQFDNFQILPLTDNHQDVKKLARDESSYNLTAVLVGESITDDFLFKLEAVLSFIEHLNVLITSPIESTNESPFSQLNQKIITRRRNNGGGAVIREDTFFGDSRKIFIQKAMNKLQDENFCQQTKFKILFFKCVEAFRSSDFLDVQYFLLFSGLESFARDSTHDYISHAAIPIYKCLVHYGFDVLEGEKPENLNPDELIKAVSSYVKLRNALFHNSSFLQETRGVKYDLFKYFPYFRLLVPLVILKIVEFDDDYINWNKWTQFQ